MINLRKLQNKIQKNFSGKKGKKIDLLLKERIKIVTFFRNCGSKEE